MKEKENNGSFKVMLMKKDPKPNAPRYEIETIEQFSAMLTHENYERCLAEFRTTVELSLHMKDALLAIMERDGEVTQEMKDAVRMKTFIWIDD